MRARGRRLGPPRLTSGSRMRRRGHWVLAATLIAVDACVPDPPPTSTPGALGNGAFSYACPNGSDSACDGVDGDSAVLPGEIAVGASFGLTYAPSSHLSA